MNGARRRAERDMERDAWLAWRGAWAGRTERFPSSLDKFTGRKSEPRRQTVEEMEAIWLGWHAVLSGPH